MPEGPLHAFVIADAVAIALGLSLAAGGLASRAWLRTHGSAWAARTLAQARAARRLGFALGLAGLAFAPWLEAAAMGEVPLSQSADALATLLEHTHFGHAALAGFAAWLLAGALVLVPDDDEVAPWRRAVGALALAFFFVTRSVVSHAGAHGDVTLAVGVDALHLGAACLWVGVVLGGARLALPPESATGAERADAAQWVTRMSTTATLALGVVLATGAFKAWQAFAPVASLAQGAGTDYGRMFGAKLALVVIAALLGGVNRFVVLPALSGRRPSSRAGDGARWRRRLIGILRVEAITLLLVLTAAALLAGTEPPDARASADGGNAGSGLKT